MVFCTWCVPGLGKGGGVLYDMQLVVAAWVGGGACDVAFYIVSDI